MPNVFVEPRPKASNALTNPPIDHYVLELEGDVPVDGVRYRTQEEAIAAAKRLGHKPNVARVRHTDKGKPDQWRAA
jgi:hypothetical protein